MAKIKNIESTSNPDEMRFVVDQPLTRGESRSFSSQNEAGEDELARSVLAIDHVKNIYYANYHVTVQQDGKAPWSSLLKQIAPFIREAKPVRDRDGGQANTENKRSSVSGSERKRIAQYLREVIDPELGVNIVDLGLIYDIVEEEDKIVIHFTATTPGCPMQHYLEQRIHRSVSKVVSDKNVEPELVWQPSWDIEMMSPELKRHFNPA